jgi:hypothetical protein
MFLVSLVLFLVAGHDAITFKMPFSDIGKRYFADDAIRLSLSQQVAFIITAEQLIIQHGVFPSKQRLH